MGSRSKRTRLAGALAASLAFLPAGRLAAQETPASFEETRLVKAYLAHGAHKEALDYIDQVLPGAQDALLHRDLCLEKARLLRTRGKLAEGLQALQGTETLELTPSQRTQVQLLQASLLDSLGSSAEAQAAYKSAWQNADDDWTADAAGRQLLRRLTPEQADELVAWAKGSGAPEARVLRLVGSLYLATGRPAQAAEAWRRRLAIPPWDDEIYQRLVQHYRAQQDTQGRVEAAVFRWRQLEGSNLRYDALQDILLAHREAGEMATAVDTWRKQAASGDSLATRLLAEQAWAGGVGSEEGLAWDKSVLRSDPNDSRAYTRSSRFLKESDRLQDLVDLGLLLAPACTDPVLANLVGKDLSTALRHLSNEEGARERLNGLRREHPADRVVRHALAALEEDIPELLDERISVLEELAALAPDDPVTNHVLIQALMAAGRDETVLGLLPGLEARLPKQREWLAPARLTVLIHLGRSQAAAEAVRATLKMASLPGSGTAEDIQAHELTLILYIADRHGTPEDQAASLALRDRQYVFPQARVEQEFMNALAGRGLGDPDYVRAAVGRMESLIPREKWPDTIRQAVENAVDRWLEKQNK